MSELAGLAYGVEKIFAVETAPGVLLLEAVITLDGDVLALFDADPYLRPWPAAEAARALRPSRGGVKAVQLGTRFARFADGEVRYLDSGAVSLLASSALDRLKAWAGDLSVALGVPVFLPKGVVELSDERASGIGELGCRHGWWSTAGDGGHDWRGVLRPAWEAPLDYLPAHGLTLNDFAVDLSGDVVRLVPAELALERWEQDRDPDCFQIAAMGAHRSPSGIVLWVRSRMLADPLDDPSVDFVTFVLDASDERIRAGLARRGRLVQQPDDGVQAAPATLLAEISILARELAGRVADRRWKPEQVYPSPDVVVALFRKLGWDGESDVDLAAPGAVATDDDNDVIPGGAGRLARALGVQLSVAQYDVDASVENDASGRTNQFDERHYMRLVDAEEDLPPLPVSTLRPLAPANRVGLAAEYTRVLAGRGRGPTTLAWSAVWAAPYPSPLLEEGGAGWGALLGAAGIVNAASHLGHEAELQLIIDQPVHGGAAALAAWLRGLESRLNRPLRLQVDGPYARQLGLADGVVADSDVLARHGSTILDSPTAAPRWVWLGSGVLRAGAGELRPAFLGAVTGREYELPVGLSVVLESRPQVSDAGVEQLRAAGIGVEAAAGRTMADVARTVAGLGPGLSEAR
jgi:hypothetical protein